MKRLLSDRWFKENPEDNENNMENLNLEDNEIEGLEILEDNQILENLDSEISEEGDKIEEMEPEYLDE